MNDDTAGPRSIPLSGWKIRFDTPPREPDSRRAERGDLLALFRAWDGAQRPAEPDRRRAPRYAPAVRRAWVGWWRRGHFLVTRATLVNLSQGGALLRLAQAPPTAVPVWVCLGAPHPVDYVQARILESRAASPTAADPAPPPPETPAVGDESDGEGEGESNLPFEARLEFHSPCPASFFQAAGSLADPADTDLGGE